MSPQELLALESLSSLSLYCASCQLPDATVTSGWHSLRQLNFTAGGEDAAALEQAWDAITALPHLDSLRCCLKAVPAQFSALSKLRELKVQLPEFEDYNSQVGHLSPPDHKSLYHKWR